MTQSSSQLNFFCCEQVYNFTKILVIISLSLVISPISPTFCTCCHLFSSTPGTLLHSLCLFVTTQYVSCTIKFYVPFASSPIKNDYWLLSFRREWAGAKARDIRSSSSNKLPCHVRKKGPSLFQSTVVECRTRKKVKCEANRNTKTRSPRDPCTYCLKMMRVNVRRYTMNIVEMSFAFVS